MEWIGTVLAGLALLVLLAPALLLATTVFVLVPLAHLLPPAPTVSRACFNCPFSRRRVTVAFLSEPGASRPSEVLSCSLFADGRVRCKQECLDLVEARWAPSTAVARYALLADGEVRREAA